MLKIIKLNLAARANISQIKNAIVAVTVGMPCGDEWGGGSVSSIDLDRSVGQFIVRKVDGNGKPCQFVNGNSSMPGADKTVHGPFDFIGIPSESVTYTQGIDVPEQVKGQNQK